MIQNSKDHSCWIRVSISIGVGLFLLALALSAVIVPQLLYLHLLQALIYLAVIVLTQRNNAWGVWHRRHRTDGLELPELIRDSSVSEGGGTVLVSNPFGPVLVSSAHWPSEPA
jgi:hypothetical protein